MILNKTGEKMKNLAIIPARSGSKGIVDKNIKLLSGKPLLAYSIKAALESKQFDTVMVSTDSEEYALISKEYGAEVPFLRSPNTSSDVASSWDVVAEVLDNYHLLGQDYDTVMLLQPTSPLRTSRSIIGAFCEMEKKSACSVVSVCETEYSPLHCNTLPDSNSLTGFINPLAKGKRRQDMEKYYRFNGAIYLTKVDFFLECHDIFRDRCFAYIMDRQESIDIDDDFDFVLAEAILNNNK